uniref:P63C domain-containing protein n=1 Tax=Candidatus Kentrum sp. FW TaxID=2126338 RepID=A0A450U404_9GAMM|nr:MAG: P63C domain-containing protein [Candidatus Kentron sp. FW]
MTGKILKATHIGSINIGHTDIPCAVLEDGTRLLTQRGFLKAIGRSEKQPGGGAEGLPPFLAAANLKPFINKYLNAPIEPVAFRRSVGGIALGYNAELLPKVCNIYLEARQGGVLNPVQIHIAEECETVIRGLATVGIVALVDEATGYQKVRHKEALQALLDKYLLQEFKAWSKRFPDDFYKEMFRLKGWDWKGMEIGSRPGVVGRYTNDIVYDRLEVGIRKELEKRNPKTEKGNRRARHHQFLTDDLGVPALSQHLHTVIAFMRASSNWEKFKRSLNRALPKKGDKIEVNKDQETNSL